MTPRLSEGRHDDSFDNAGLQVPDLCQALDQ